MFLRFLTDFGTWPEIDVLTLCLRFDQFWDIAGNRCFDNFLTIRWIPGSSGPWTILRLPLEWPKMVLGLFFEVLAKGQKMVRATLLDHFLAGPKMVEKLFENDKKWSWACPRPFFDHF